MQAKAAERRADEQAQQDLRRLLHDPDAPPVDDALAAMARLAGQLEHAVREVGERASGLNRVGVITAAGGEQLRAEVRLWELLLGRLQSCLDALAKHGWAERQTVALEQLAELSGQLVAAALDGAGAQGEQRERGLAAARSRLELVASRKTA